MESEKILIIDADTIIREIMYLGEEEFLVIIII